MIEKLIDNWLAKVNERSLQDPFRFLLTARGYTVLHVTRHTAMEIGKDVIARNSDGAICGFQLKGTPAGRLTMSQWQEMAQQAFVLATHPPSHPSIRGNVTYLPFLVVNGDIEEDVARAIEDMNRSITQTGLRPITTIVRGELRRWIGDLKDSMWPTDEFEFKEFLELLLCSGTESLPRTKMATLLESVLPVKNESTKPTNPALQRSLTNAAVISAIATSPFSAMSNHWSLIEMWTMYIAYVAAAVERYRAPAKWWRSELAIAEEAMNVRLSELAHEVMSRGSPYIEGSTLEESGVYRIRMTVLMAALAAYGIWRIRDSAPQEAIDDFIRSFVDEGSPYL